MPSGKPPDTSTVSLLLTRQSVNQELWYFNRLDPRRLIIRHHADKPAFEAFAHQCLAAQDPVLEQQTLLLDGSQARLDDDAVPR